MSYSQKIKNLLQKMKQTKNYNYNNNQQNKNMPRNFVEYKNNIPLIDEEICSNNKKFLFKKNNNKYQTSNHNSNNNSKPEYTKLFENNKKKDKFNNNFIVETNYEKNKTKINESNKINTNNSFRNNFNVNNITYQNTGKNYLNNNSIGEEKNLLKYKISHINTDNKNISHIYSSYHKIKNLNNSDYDIPNKIKIELNKENYLYLNVYETNIDRFDTIKMNLETLLFQTECIIIMWDNNVKTFENIISLIRTIIDCLKNKNDRNVPLSFILFLNFNLVFHPKPNTGGEILLQNKNDLDLDYDRMIDLASKIMILI
jgi:hypothetical protein